MGALKQGTTSTNQTTINRRQSSAAWEQNSTLGRIYDWVLDTGPEREMFSWLHDSDVEVKEWGCDAR